MKPEAWLVLVWFAVSCSSRDQSLGETRPSPQPIIDVEPQPDPDPDPDPNPDPTPSIPPCEDSSKHARTGACVARAECPRPPITDAGYECAGDAVCCDPGVGCGTDGCATGGSAPTQGGAGAAGPDPTGGAGGSP
jgi:hypothetical protein